jgi:hypothetical protein
VLAVRTTSESGFHRPGYSFGRLVLPGGAALADVWLAAAVYLLAAERSVEIAAYA